MAFFSHFSDGFLIRFALRHCHHHEYPHYTIFECHNEVNYLLTRHCTQEYYVFRGPCCKIDEAFDYLTNENPELFAAIKWVIQTDDDTFVRADETMRFLAAVENSGIGHLPLVGNGDKTNSGEVKYRGMWHIEGCKEIDSGGWYQPWIINHAALDRMRLASKHHGLMDFCGSFDLSQDVGIGGYVWLFQPYHIQFPGVVVNGRHEGATVFRPDQLAVHAIKLDNRDGCVEDKLNDWPNKKKRFDQQFLIGCGDIDQHIPLHNATRKADMYDAWEYFRDHGKSRVYGKIGENEWIEGNVLLGVNNSTEKEIIKEVIDPGIVIGPDGLYHGEKVVKRVIPLIRRLGGYESTKHGKTYDIYTKEYHGFKPQDCDPPGKIRGKG